MGFFMVYVYDTIIMSIMNTITLLFHDEILSLFGNNMKSHVD